MSQQKMITDSQLPTTWISPYQEVLPSKICSWGVAIDTGRLVSRAIRELVVVHRRWSIQD